MNKNHFFTFFIVLGLSIVFILVSILAIFNSNNPRFLKYKLKIGAAIIVLTTFANTNVFSQKTCYKPSMAREVIRLDKQDSTEIIKIYKEEKSITGRIDNVLSVDYSFTITDSSKKQVKKGTLVAINGKFDEEKENFEINIGQLKAGQYNLKIYSNKNSENGNYLYDGTLIILDKKEPPVMCYYY